MSPSRPSFPASQVLTVLLLALCAGCCCRLEAALPGQMVLLACLLSCFALGWATLPGRNANTAPTQSLLPLLALALLVRLLLFPHSTLDYQDFLSHWVEHFRQNGGVLALKDPVGNYNVPYLYLLCLISYLPVNDLYLIKFLSVAFDLVLAWGGGRLVFALRGEERMQRYAFFTLLFLPTVVLNGACWGQCDSIWAALCVHALAAALLGEHRRSAILAGLAFSFKLQAIFLLPLWGMLWLLGRFPFRTLWAIPLTAAATALPALLAGRPAESILAVYLGQASSSAAGSVLNYNSPSLFTLLPYGAQVPSWTAKGAILLAFLFLAVVLLVLLSRGRKVGDLSLALAGAALSLGIPFLLPYMHERYFFLGGVLLVSLSTLLPRLAPAALAAELASLGGYHAYLLKRYALVLSFAGRTWTQLGEGLCLAFALGCVCFHLFRSTGGKATS